MSQEKHNAPWAGNLSCDLRRGPISVRADALAIIDEKGVAWATVFPDARGFYDHASFIVRSVNALPALVKALEEIEAMGRNRPLDHAIRMGNVARNVLESVRSAK